MNKGIDKATGEWINFMNGGDSFYNQNVISDIILYLPNTNVLYGETISRNTKHKLKTYPIHKLNLHMPFCHQSCFVNTILHKKYPFDTSYKYAGDYNFFFNLYRKSYVFKFCPTVISIYDKTGASSLNYSICLKEYARARGTHHTLKFKIYMIFMVLYVHFKKLIWR
jgi:hypothetical protein